ncbi:hypothetical protein [Nonomuraea indica]|uniref:DUF4386 family protein n=1 Tax=Nonomuraea indica TaxID=1581193 RepID=A0ABW8A8D9_9ACTN|nr:hypothetical protein [Nonomuraea indica]
MQNTAEPPAKALRTPRAAGAAGILSALLLGGAMILVRRAIPERPLDAAAHLSGATGHDALRLALVLLPFGGVFFLWFMGALRDSIGIREDRFFATVFLGAGLLYVALLFVFGATAKAFVVTIDALKGSLPPTGLPHYGRHLTITLLTEYAPRMAGVFTLTTTTIVSRLGLFPRWLLLAGYLVGLVQLLLVSRIAWSEMVFPVWVMVVGFFLLVSPSERADAPDPPGR